MGAWTPRAHGAREGRVRGFLGGALRCLADSEAPPKKKNGPGRRFSVERAMDPG
jgi:hypothetical protein